MKTSNAERRTPNAELPIPNYVERSAKMRAAARKVELARIGKIYAIFKRRVTVAIEAFGFAVCDAREMGILLQEVSGHEQMPLNFWNGNCADKLPFDLDAAKKFIAIAHKLPDIVPASFTEVFPFLAPVLQAEKILRLKVRTKAQTASTVSADQKFLTKLAMLRQPFKKATARTALKQKDVAMLKLIVAESDWLASARTEALALLQDKI